MAQVLSEDPTFDRVVGVDVVAPVHDIGSAEFVRADIRNPIIASVIAGSEVDTVMHMGVIATPMQAGGRMSMKEINVIGTMQLLAACQKSPSVKHLVVKSTTGVYGSGPRDPAMFTEGSQPTHVPRSGWSKDSVEVEAYVRGFSRRRPDVTVTTLRLANFLGARVETPMTSYFSLPIVPTVLGYDARLQFLHEDDGLAALHHAALSMHHGTVNVAGDGIILLSQAVRRAGRVTVPVLMPLTSLVGGMVRRAGLADFSPEQVQFLAFGRGVDTTRMRADFGFEPHYTTAEVFNEFVRSRGLDRHLSAERITELEQALLGVATRGRLSA
jgi:UDP-glucose 4-epimerase